MRDSADLFLLILAFSGTSFFGGFILGAEAVQDTERAEAKEAGVGCYQPRSGEFEYDESCPASKTDH